MSEHAQLMEMQARILEAIDRNNDLLLRMIEALAGIRSKSESAKAETTKVIEKAKATESVAPAPSPTADPPAAAPAATDPTQVVSFDDAKKALMSIPADRARAILKGMGVAKLSELDADRYPDLVEACNG